MDESQIGFVLTPQDGVANYLFWKWNLVSYWYNRRLLLEKPLLGRFVLGTLSCQEVGPDRSLIVMEPIVELQCGFVRGNIEKHEDGFEYYSFKGIPYAEPPVGALRFKDPIPKKKWAGVVDCKTDGPMCLQYHFISKIRSYEENCLHLNIFTRSINEANADKPVLVIIHAGGVVFGSADSSFYGPDYLIKKDVVLVVPSYRVGVLGFLDLEDEIAPGNQGLKDLVLALECIQQNVGMFGGDANNVTVIGLLAGAIVAHYLALSPLTKGLIHKVISGSGVVYTAWSAVTNPKLHATRLCSLLGKHLTDSKEIFEFLQSVDVRKLQEGQELLQRTLNCYPFGAGVDSKSPNPFMPLHRYIVADQGVHLPYLVGCNAHEGLTLLTVISKEDFFKLANLDFGKLLEFNTKDVLSRYNLTETQVKRLYYGNETVSHKNLDNFFKLANDLYYFESIHRFARVQAEQSSAATYLYQFSYASPNPINASTLENLPDEFKRRCGRMEEMPFLFKMRSFESKGFPSLKKGTQRYKVMEQLTDLWTNFARYGRPTVGTSELIPVHWQPITDGTVLRYLNIDEDVTMQTTMNIDQKFLAARNIKI